MCIGIAATAEVVTAEVVAHDSRSLTHSHDRQQKTTHRRESNDDPREGRGVPLRSNTGTLVLLLLLAHNDVVRVRVDGGGGGSADSRGWAVTAFSRPCNDRLDLSELYGFLHDR